MPSLIAKYDLHEADLEILREAIDGIEYPCPLPTDLFPFGKHAGKPYWLIPREYFVWCWRQSMLQQDVRDYMTHRKHWIEKQKLDEEQERNEIIKDLAAFTLDL